MENNENENNFQLPIPDKANTEQGGSNNLAVEHNKSERAGDSNQVNMVQIGPKNPHLGRDGGQGGRR